MSAENPDRYEQDKIDMIDHQAERRLLLEGPVITSGELGADTQASAPAIRSFSHKMLGVMPIVRGMSKQL